MQALKIIKVIEVDVPGLGQRIKQARENDHRTLKAICEAAGMSPQNWSRIEKESQAVPIEVLRRIEAALGKEFGVEI
ncbi:helix-turn-helix transcriptional regulator [Allocoleopsis sp.]|uniref:helix-turn-helix domain-containing protein n=1 Tax=Allocoleopsis sp. TaxID=3088169 RepID=UPI0032C23E4A